MNTVGPSPEVSPRDRTPFPGLLWVGVVVMLAIAGGYVGCEIGHGRRVSMDDAAGVSSKEPIFTDLEMGGFFAGSCVGATTGLFLFRRARKERRGRFAG